MIAAFLSVAAAAFGPTTCGTPAVSVAPVPVSDNGQVAGRAWPDECRIVLDPGHWWAMPPRRRCHLVVHEYGHLAGLLEHSADPGSVMFADVYEPVPFEPCAGAARSLRRPFRAAGRGESRRRAFRWGRPVAPRTTKAPPSRS